MNAVSPMLAHEVLRARLSAQRAAVRMAPTRTAEREAKQQFRWLRWAAIFVLRLRGHSQEWIALRLRIDKRSVAYGMQTAARLANDDPEFHALLSTLAKETRHCPGNVPGKPVPEDRALRAWRAVLTAIAAERGLLADDLIGRSLVRYVVAARQLAMAVLVARGNSRMQVARWLGRDHTTVIYALECFAARTAQPAGAAALAEFRRYAPAGVEPADLVRRRGA